MHAVVRRTPRAAALAAVLVVVPAGTAAAQTTAPADEGASSTSTTAPAATTPAAPPTATAASPTAAVTLTRTETRKLQRKLRVRADGAMGPKTRAAIRRAERRYALRVDGRPDVTLLKKLRLAPPASATAPAAAGTGQPAADEAGTPAATGVAASPSGVGAAAVAAARSQIGTPYASAGDTPGGFDCSGLVAWAFTQAGVSLPRSSFEQFGAGAPVERAQIQAGDLVFFDTAGDGASHDGIATSPTTAISATTRGVVEHRIDDEYWGAHYVGARRLG